MGRPGLNRRQLLAAVGGLTVAGSFGFAALGAGADALASGARTRVRYWNLFSGGDGGNMVAMVDAFRKQNPDVAVKASTLTWGGPYYTKLAMAAAGSRAPDLAVMHQGRVPGFAPGRLLDAWDMDLLGPDRHDGSRRGTLADLALTFGMGPARLAQDADRVGRVPALDPQALHPGRASSTPASSPTGSSTRSSSRSVSPSTYKIRVGRSTSVTGPYADSTGKPMPAGGGDLLLASHGRYIGPGGESIFKDKGKDVLAYHHYDAEDSGTPKLGLNTLGWTKNGWPIVLQGRGAVSICGSAA